MNPGPRYAELQVTTQFSFLRGASSAEELFITAAHLGIEALAVVDRNSMAGMVRAWEASKSTGVRLVVGCRLDLADGTTLLAYPIDRPAYSRLCRLLSLGKARGGKGKCRLDWADVAAHAEGLLAVLVPEQADEECGLRLRRLRETFGDRAYLALTLRRRPNDQLRLHELSNLAARMRVPTVVTNDVLFHDPSRRILQDVLSCIRDNTVIDQLGAQRGRPILEQQRRQASSTPWLPTGSTNQPSPEQVQINQARQSGLFIRTEPKTRPAIPESQSTANPSALVSVAEAATPDEPQRRMDFLVRPDAGGIYNPYAEQRPAFSYQIMAGSIIAAALVTGLNSDLPGTVTAQVTENVYDTVTGQILLIPQGTRLIGTYDSRVSFGQERALLVWQRLIRPDGLSLQLENLPASDTRGRSGLTDDVDFHTGRLLKGIAMVTLLGVATELTFGQQESDLVRAVRESVQQNADRAGQRLVERNLDIQPTLTVRPGWPLRVIVRRDLILSPYRGG